MDSPRPGDDTVQRKPVKERLGRVGGTEPCPSCGNVYHNRSSLRRHIQVVHMVSRFHCLMSGCTAILKRRDYVTEHFARQHTGTKATEDVSFYKVTSKAPAPVPPVKRKLESKTEEKENNAPARKKPTTLSVDSVVRSAPQAPKPVTPLERLEDEMKREQQLERRQEEVRRGREENLRERKRLQVEWEKLASAKDRFQAVYVQREQESAHYNRKYWGPGQAMRQLTPPSPVHSSTQTVTAEQTSISVQVDLDDEDLKLTMDLSPSPSPSSDSASSSSSSVSSSSSSGSSSSSSSGSSSPSSSSSSSSSSSPYTSPQLNSTVTLKDCLSQLDALELEEANVELNYYDDIDLDLVL